MTYRAQLHYEAKGYRLPEDNHRYNPWYHDADGTYTFTGRGIATS